MIPPFIFELVLLLMAGACLLAVMVVVSLSCLCAGYLAKRLGYHRRYGYIAALLLFGVLFAIPIKPDGRNSYTYAWGFAKLIYEPFARSARFKEMPDPVVVQGDVYWFPLNNRVFAVPKAYVESYGRNSTDGRISSFSLHALLPDMAGHSPENADKFLARMRGGLITMWVHSARNSTYEESAKFSYKRYLLAKSIAPPSAVEVVSQPSPESRIVKISQRAGDVGIDYFYLIENDRVLKEVNCNQRRKDGGNNPACQNLGVFYEEGAGLRIWIFYSADYQADWIKIEDSVVALLKSFERPEDDFPKPALLKE